MTTAPTRSPETGSFHSNGTLHANDVAVSASVKRWMVCPLAWNLPMPDVGNGLGLLWAKDDLQLAQDRKVEALQAGDLALIRRQEPFSLMAEGRWTADLIELGRTSFGSRVSADNYRIAAALDGKKPLAISIKALCAVGQSIAGLEFADDAIHARMVDLIGELARRLASADYGQSLTVHQTRMIERAKLAIATFFRDPRFSVATLATHMRLSPRHLSSLFAAMGTTATKTILEQRLGEARNLLLDPDNHHRQIAWIAHRSGFADPNYFTRCFREANGLAPRQFRDMLDSSTSRSDL